MTTTPLSVAGMQARLAQSKFIDFLGMTVVSADPAKQEVVMTVPMRPEFELGAGSRQWHGGPIAAVIDTVGDYALIMTLGRGLPTIHFSVDYLRPAIDTGLHVTARVRRSGKSVGVVDIEVCSDKGVLLAIGRASYSTLMG